MERRKYTPYILDKNNRFFKDCLHQYIQEVRSFEDHFTPQQLDKIRKIRKKRASRDKQNLLKRKPHKYHL